jgi:adenylate cyclase
MRVAVREHNNIMRRNLRHCNGYEIKTEGDAFIVAFSDLLDAIRWTMTSQLQLLETDWPQDIIETRDGMEVHGPKSLEADEGETLLYRGLSIRMGMHCGYPVCELDPVTRRMDYFGPVINKAARVCSQAEGGQILVSQDVERHFRRLCTSFENSSGSPVPRGRGGRAANGNIAEKMALIKLIDPVFISAGERKLKGFETPEMLISLWPRVIVGRQKVPPPPLEPEKTKTEPPKIEEVKTNGSTEEQVAKVPVDKASEETASAAALAIAVSADSPEPSFTETSVDEASILGQRFGAVIRKLLKQASGEETSQTLLERVEEMLERLEHLVPSVDGTWTAEHCEELIASASSQATKTALRMIQLFISLKTEQQPLESSAGDVA